MDFSETIIVYDIKVGRCSQPNAYMKLYEYQRSMLLFESDSTFSNFFSLETAGPIESIYHVEPPWDGGIKVSTNGLCHMTMTKIASMSIYGKHL